MIQITRRNIKRLALGGLTLVAIPLAVGWGFLWLPATARWLTERVLSAAVHDDFAVEIGSSRIWLPGRIRLADVTVLREDGTAVLEAKRLDLQYRIRPLLGRRVELPSVRVLEPVGDIRRSGASWELSSLSPPSSAPPDPTRRWEVTIADLRVDGGRLTVSSDGHPTGAVADLRLHGGGIVLSDSLAARLESLTFQATSPHTPGTLQARLGGSLADGLLRVDTLSLSSPSSRVTAEGTLPWPVVWPPEPSTPDRIGFRLDASELVLGDLGFLGLPLHPDARLEGAFEAKGQGGQGASILVDLAMGDGSSAHLDGTLEWDREAPADSPAFASIAAMRGTTQVLEIDPSYLTTSAPPGRVSLTGTADLARQGLPGSGVLVGGADLDIQRSELSEYVVEPSRLRIDADSAGVAMAYMGTLRSTVRGLAARIRAEGTAVPGSDPLSYSATAETTIEASQGRSLLVRLDGRGAGVEPDALTGVWTLTLPDQVISDQPVSGRLSYRPDSGTGPWEVNLSHGPGRVDGSGTAALTPDLELVIDRLVAEEVDLASLMGDTISASVSAALEGRLGRAADGDLFAEAVLDLSQSQWGEAALPGASARGSLRAGRATVSIQSTQPGPEFQIDAVATPFQDPPIVRIERGRFAGLDPTFSQDEPRPMWLNGSFEGRFAGRSVASGTAEISVQLDSSRVADLTLSGGTATASLEAGSVDGHLTALYPGGDAEASLEVEFEAGGWERVSLTELTIRGLDLGLFAPEADLHTSVNGAGDGVLTRGLDGRPSGEGRFRIQPSTLNEARVSEGLLEATWAAGLVSGEGSLLGLGGDLQISGSARWDDGRIRDGQGQVRFDFTELGPLLGLDVPLTARGQGSVLRGPQTEEWDVQVGAEGRWDRLVVDSASLAGRWSPEVIVVDTLWVQTNALRAEGVGTVVLDTNSGVLPDFRMTASLTDAQPLAPFINAEVLEVGTARAEARLQPTPTGMTLEGEFEANAILIDGIRVVGLDGDWQAHGTSVSQVDSAQMAVNVRRITNQRQIDIASVDVDLDYGGELLALTLSAGVDETRNGELRALLDVEAPAFRWDVERLRFSIDDDVWTLRESVRIDRSDGFRIASGEIVAGDQRIAFGGGLHPTLPDSFSVNVAGFRVGTVSDLLGFPWVEATLNSDLTLTGSLSDPTWQLEAEADTRGRGRNQGRVVLDLGYENQRLQTDIDLRDTRGNALTISGYVPLGLDFTDPENVVREVAGEADLRARADSFDVRGFDLFLDPELVQNFNGFVSIDATVGGRTSDPVLQGSARIRGGSASLPQLGTHYRSIEGNLELRGRTVRIAEATVADDDGSARLSGNLELESLGLGRFDLVASLDELLLVSNHLSRARASGDVRIVGTTLQPAVEGTAEIVSADVYLQGQSTQRHVESVELTPDDFEMLRQTFGYRPTQASPGAGALANALSTNLQLTIGRDTWLRQRVNPELAVQLSGELDIQKEPNADPRVVGTIVPIAGRSYVEQWGRRFELESGEIVFQGPALEPLVQLSAIYDIPSRDNPGGSEVVIRLDIEGRPDSLRLILSSTPAMDNADIVSYIATGRSAARSLSGSEGAPNVSDVGVELAAGRLTSAIEGLAADAIGLDVVEIRREGPRDAVLVAGRYVSPRLYIGFQQPVSLGSSGSPAQQAAGQRVEIEYEAFRWLLLNLEGGRSDVEFFFRTRYGY